MEADTYGLTEISTDNGYTLLEDSINVAITPTDREINASVAGTTGMDKAAIDSIVQYYHGGIFDENGDLVTASKDYIKIQMVAVQLFRMQTDVQSVRPICS